MLEQLRSKSVSKQVLLVTILVALLPITILGYHIYQSAWDDSWREVREKHQLLAQNLAVPLQNYVNNHRGFLQMTAQHVAMQDVRSREDATSLLRTSLHNMTGFRSLIQLDMQGRIMGYVQSGSAPTAAMDVQVFATEQCYLMTRDSGEWSISRVKRNPLSGKPTIFMGQPIYSVGGKMIGVLLGELRIELIEAIRARVRFGERGHAAFVDQTGHVIAHPDVLWMEEIRNLSDWPIVQAMLIGKTGVMSFYSSYMQADMVAGYATVPGIGWGIMVPQPQAEIAARVHGLMLSHLLWAMAGVLLAVALAILLARWIIAPLDQLARAGRGLMQDGVQGNLPAVRSDAPQEVRELGAVMRALIAGLQGSRDEISKLNESLQKRVDEATSRLRESNSKLEKLARRDSLTELANRRYFEHSLVQALSRRSGDVDEVCIMLLDIDHFKQINDIYGHAAGDAVLNHIARVLEQGMRAEDLVARYGGDEFVAYMRCTHEVGLQRAREIRAAIDQYAVAWNGRNIHITVSIGMYYQTLQEDIDVNKLLGNADNAMYEAKRQGRNRVVEINH